jgi:hypothetical protein
MATYTSLINSVLVRLRESTVSGPSSTDYAGLIGALVNETKREVEDAWKWNTLRTTIPITTEQGTSQYSLTGAGQRFKLQDPLNSVYDVTNLAQLTPQNPQWIKKSALANSNEGTPSFYYFEGMDSNGDMYVHLYATPDDVATINFELVVPQDTFTVGTEVLSVPEMPVILGAYAKAIAERGEDNGSTHGGGQQKYQAALSDAIAIDESLTFGETTWYV